MAGPGAEVGSSGLLIATGGYITEELHPNLVGRQALNIWRVMKDNDALVGAILFAIDMLIRQVEWSVHKGDAKDADQQFLEECMEDMSMSWGDFISEVLSMLPFGFAPMEIVYKQRKGPSSNITDSASSRFNDGKIGWRKIPLRAQETLDHWEFDDQGGLRAFVQKAPPSYTDVTIPMEKMLLFRTTVYKNNPEGRSVLRSAYTSWFYKKRTQQIEGVGIERDLAGYPVFWLPAEFMADSASAEQKAVVAAFNVLGTNIKRDKQEFLLMPLEYDEHGNKRYDFELTAAGSRRQHDTNTVIQRYNQEIAMTVLADFILLGHEKVGSFALSSDKTDLFAVAMGTILDSIQDVMNRYAVPRLFALNGMDVTTLPEIKHGDIEKPDLVALGAYITALSGAGVPMFPDEDLEAYLREAANLPEVSEQTKKEREQRAQQAADQFSQTKPGTDGAPGGPNSGAGITPGSGKPGGNVPATDGSGPGPGGGQGGTGPQGAF